MKAFKWKNIDNYWLHLIIFKLTALMILNLIPFDFPHVWRQVDTMAVAMRYWQRWTLELDPYPLLPAVLNSGDSIGYMGMEFPFINLIVAPLFYFGPSLGVTLARLFLLSFNILLWLWAVRAWRGIVINGVDAGKAFKWLPLLGLTANYMGRFIPDTSAMLLCLIGCAYIWKHNTSLLGFVLLVLGILIKPPALISCGILLLRSGDIKTRFKHLTLPTLAILSASIYYILAVPALNQIESNPSLFATTPRHPIYSFLEFFSEPLNILKLLSGNVIFPGGLFAITLLMILGRKNYSIRGLFPYLYILTLMMIGVAVLDGSHSFIHAYYHMGLMPIVALLFYGLTKAKLNNKLLRGTQSLLILAFLIFQLTTVQFDLRNIFGPVKAERMPAMTECQDLKKNLPDLPWNQAKIFKTGHHQYPKLGLCFSERTGHDVNAEYGLYYLSEALPSNCIKIRNSKNLQVAKCNI